MIELIGRGGMGAVYHARQISLDRPVAIKILPPALWHEDQDYAERFRHEARLMARLSHPAMISVHDFGSMPDGQLYFIMEYVQGTDVAQMLQKSGRLAPLHALAIAAHVCDALTYAHQHGVIHRDIKPANVMVDRDGRVKVADFGLARFEAQESASSQSTMTMGTPDYLAPEALQIGSVVDARADLYSLGIMLYEMLTGRVPHGAFVPPSQKILGLDPRFDKIFVRALQHDPRQRYQTAAELRADLDRIVNTPAEKPKPAAARQPALSPVLRTEAEPPAKMVPWNLLAAAITVLIAMAALIYWNPKAAELALEPPSASPMEEKPAAETGAAPVSLITASSPASEHAASNVIILTPDTQVQPRAPVTAAPVQSVISATPSSTSPQVRVEPMTSTPAAGAKADSLPESEAAKRLRDLDTSFQAALDRDVTKVFQEGRADVARKYEAALTKAQASALSLGHVPEAEAIREERKLLGQGLAIPNDDNSTPDSLRKLRVVYRLSSAGKEEDRKKAAAVLYNKYLEVLAAYESELTKAGRTEEAALVTEKRREIALAASRARH